MGDGRASEASLGDESAAAGLAKLRARTRAADGLTAAAPDDPPPSARLRVTSATRAGIMDLLLLCIPLPERITRRTSSRSGNSPLAGDTH